MVIMSKPFTKFVTAEYSYLRVCLYLFISYEIVINVVQQRVSIFEMGSVQLLTVPHPSRIIPQAISVRYGLYVGAHCAPLVMILMFLLGKLLIIHFVPYSSYYYVRFSWFPIQLPSPIPSRKFWIVF